MWDNVSIVRNEKGLRSALSKMEVLKNNLENVKLRGVFEIQRYFEFKSMITVAELVTRCALERRESRGAHYRSDYPETKEEWRGNLVVSKDGIRFIEAPSV
ncbi:hypothetical protein KKP89_02055 [Methanothermococcus sp. SCGC AD-155-N22]|nr:hypothetical protein [Methanothermococcus sp. SCGC AD-155-N22]